MKKTNKKAVALLLCLVLALTALFTVTAFADTEPAADAPAQTEQTIIEIVLGGAVFIITEWLGLVPEAYHMYFLIFAYILLGGHPHHLCAVRNGERSYEHPSEY